MNPQQMLLFALDASRAFGEKVAAALDLPLSDHEQRDFEDGEHKARPLVSVRDRDVYVIQSLYGGPDQTVNDKLCRMLFFLGAVRDAAAQRVTAVAPYLCYARKERKTKPRDPITSLYVARMFEAVGVDRVVTMDVHNLAAYQNAFRCATEHLEARLLFVDHFASLDIKGDLTVVSPDSGGVGRADQFRKALSERLGRPVSSAFMEKQRSEGVVSGEAVVGDIEGRTAIIIDDLISSGTTMRRAAQACRQRGAVAVHAAATHGLFVKDADQVMADPAIESLVVADTVPPFRLKNPNVRHKLIVLDAASLFAEALRRLHTGGSIVELLEP